MPTQFNTIKSNQKQQTNRRSPFSAALIYPLSLVITGSLLAIGAIASELDSRIEDLDRSLPVETAEPAPASGADSSGGEPSYTGDPGNVYQGEPAGGYSGGDYSGEGSSGGEVVAPEPVYAPPTPRPTQSPASIPVPTQPNFNTISFGEVKPGVLGEADPLTADGRRYEYFQFEGREGQPIVITLNGSEDPRADGNLSLSPYMIIYGPNGEVVARNDVAGGTRTLADERLRIRLPQAGSYKVAVFSDPGEVGRFGLSLQRDTVIYRYEWAGELTDDNVRLDSDDSPVSYYQFSGSQGQFVNILATSPDFDAYLFLLDPQGNVIAQDDDSGGNLSALIEKELPESGMYTVVVNAFGTEGRGRYRLLVY